jgi:hypothetical protein
VSREKNQIFKNGKTIFLKVLTTSQSIGIFSIAFLGPPCGVYEKK